MKINSKNIDRFILEETNKVLNELFEEEFSFLKNSEELKKQKEMEKYIADRDISSNSKADQKERRRKNASNEAEEEPEETEEETEEEAEETAEEETEDESEEPEQETKEELKTKKVNKSKGKWTADSPKLKVSPVKTIKDPNFSHIKAAMNLFRGGKSIEDPKIKKQLKNYINDLSNSEKQALYTFFISTAQILAGQTDKEKIIDPSEVGIFIASDGKKKKKKEKSVEKVVPNSQIPSGVATPIVVGEVANKSIIKKIINSNR